ncbi:multicopper oxidase [Viridothelium virens]|uniref:Multicopper oxidase n=1 Tax=Viridothelium virens TaxID=1048519 RepID=A0A6A6H5R4_VIRVR|nr:multicopper oxidase [Viridothelium virens]
MTTVVSGQTIPSYPSGSGSVSTAPGTSIVTSPTIRPSHGFGNSSSRPITTSLPVTTSAILPNVTTSLNSTKPSNTTAACTTKPTPQCIPCEGAPDPSAPWCGYDINTDFYKYVPRTCKTVEYDFVVTNTTISPDGVPRMGLLVNGQMPGPAIEANWGDTVVVRLTNNLPADGNNGTTFHFHGLRQNYTNEMDGVPSITQCPVAPGESMTYTWVATQYGTSWYHSHFQLQAWEGVMGPIVIHGPSSADYDVDMGPIVLQDWSHQTVDQMYDAAQDGTTGGPRVLDTGLINGMNVFGADGASNQTGKRYQLEFIPGKKHLLRVVNTAIQSTFKFYIDGHKLQVISTDFVPIKPYTTSILNINIGQRYDVIVEANQPVGDYWMRSDNQDACAVITNAKNIKGIVHYAGSSGSTPTSVGFNYTSECVDEPSSSLIPVVPYTVGSSNTEYDETVVVSANNSLNLYRWYLYGTTSATPETFQSEWSDPTLYEIWKNDTVPPYSGGLAISVPKLKEWVYVVIESPIPLPHPIHLHGHDFYILGSGSGTYDSSSSASLNLNNPPRRDVALLPTAGYLVLAFQTDNPGVWLMHCHIGWHTSMGFAMQIVEAQDLIKPSIDDTCLLDDTCKSWRKYANSASLTTTDSGV